MTPWGEIKKLKTACREQWGEALVRLESMGVTVTPWPGVGLVMIDAGELHVSKDAEVRARLLKRQLVRFHPKGILECGDHVESYELQKKHELEPGWFLDKNKFNPEETIRLFVKSVANQIVKDCDACNTTRFFVRAEPTCGVAKGDDFGNWLIALALGAPSPIQNKLTVDNVEAQMRRLNQRSA